MAEKVVSAINRALLPQLQELKGELKAINARLDAADTKTDGFRSEFRAEINRLDDKIDTNFKRLDDKIDSMKNELHSDIARVDQKVDFAKEVELLKIKVAELERRGH
jgi:hypothetical protein